MIPESLGGRLTCQFLCNDCNSRLGSKVEAAARLDPSVRIAVHNLSKKFPKLAAKLIDNQPQIAESKGGQVRGYLQGGKFRVHSTRESDGSLIQPTNEARRAVETMLRRSGYDSAPLQHALRVFDDALEDKRIEIAPGLEVAKWSIQKIQPDLSRPLMDPFSSAEDCIRVSCPSPWHSSI